jgi:hypothetical protein
MTLVQVSETEVTIETEMINHSSAANKAACNENTDFARWLNEDRSTTFKLSK